MGGLISQPMIETTNERGEGLDLKYGICSAQGWRPTMEDEHNAKIGLDYGLDDWSFFAVFDGHAGGFASRFASKHLLEFILRDEHFGLHLSGEPGTPQVDRKELEIELAQDLFGPATTIPQLTSVETVKNAIRSAFLSIDQAMRKASNTYNSGCTVTCSLISPQYCYIANCGDSRAVLYSDSNLRFVTSDHKPFRDDEKQRIQKAGGVASMRINGMLAVSRALGDFQYKSNLDMGPCEQLVSPEPEIDCLKRSEKDKFLVIACDGIWDVITNKELCLFIDYRMKVDPDIDSICSSVIDICLQKGSTDNMSIILVVFEAGERVSEEEIAREKENDLMLLEIVKKFLDEEYPPTFFEFVESIDLLMRQIPPKILPPGIGIQGKYKLLRQKFYPDDSPVLTNIQLFATTN